jgi:hypothetical protein
MMGRRMVFGEVVGLVQDAFAPIDVELLLAHAVADPVEAHVDGFGSLLLDSVIGDARRSAIIGLQGRWRLGMPEFFKGDPDGAGFFAIVEEGGELSFGGAGEHFSHDLA